VVNPNYTSDFYPKSALYVATVRGLVHVVKAILNLPAIDIRLSFPSTHPYEEWKHCFELRKSEQIRDLFIAYYMKTDGVAFISSSKKRSRAFFCNNPEI
jgi:hypothetical protein